MQKKIFPSIRIEGNQLVEEAKINELKNTKSVEELALFYQKSGADGLIIWDESVRKSQLENILHNLNTQIEIPVIVSGVSEDSKSLEKYLKAGASKVIVQETIVKDIHYISTLEQNIGLDNIVVGVDINMVEGVWNIFIENQQEATSINIFTWVNELEEYNIQNLLINPISFQTKARGFTTRLARRLRGITSAFLILKGYAEDMEDFVLSFIEGEADAVTDAYTFQEGLIRLEALKKHMKKRNIR